MGSTGSASLRKANVNPKKVTDSLRKATEQQIKDIEQEIDRIETIVGAQSVNGLYECKDVKTAGLTSEKCYQHIFDARKCLVGASITYEAFASAKDSLNKCWIDLDKAVEKAPLRYKFGCVYVVDLFVYFFAVLAVSVLLPFYYPSPIALGLFPVWVPASGAIGASLRYLWSLKYHVDDRMYCKSWKFGSLATPLLGSIIALGVYPIYYAASKLTESNLDMAGFLICFLAGYGWEETINLLQRFTRLTLGSLLWRKE